MEDTSGFYRNHQIDGLQFAPNAVRAPDYDLFREQHDSYSYPIEGWYWFDTEEEAKAFFNIVEEV